MFFGQEIRANNLNKASPLTLETDVKLSQAVLDPAGKGGNKKEPVCLMAEVAGKSFILAVLDPGQSWQCPLDLVLAAGTAVKFYLRGQGTVHLTGYELRDDMGDDLEMSMSSSEDEEMEDEDNTMMVKEITPKKNKTSPQKVTKNKSPATNGVVVKSGGKAKLNGKPSLGGDLDDDDDDDSSDDEDFDLGSSDDDDDDDLDDSDDDDDNDDDESEGELSFGDSSDDQEMDDDDDDDEDN